MLKAINSLYILGKKIMFTNIVYNSAGILMHVSANRLISSIYYIDPITCCDKSKKKLKQNSYLKKIVHSI